MPDDPKDTYALIRDINVLWKDIYPYLARHIADVYGRRGGVIMEAGPFCGVIHELVRQDVGDRYSIASFPEKMKKYFAEQCAWEGQSRTITIVETGPDLAGFNDDSVDLLIFRGALFFPSLFTTDYRAIYRVLAAGGCAFIGGGFGKYTPHGVISPIADRSRELNLLIGKKEVTTGMIDRDLNESSMADRCAIIEEGGLWIIMRKEDQK